MDGLCYAAGCGPSIRLGGRRVLLKGRTVGDYGTIEAEILKQRGNPFDLIRATACGRPQHTEHTRFVVRHLFQHVCRQGRAVGFRDSIEWLNTSYGACYGLWLAVRNNDPQRYTFERVCELARAADWNEISRAISIASAEDERALAQWIGRSRDRTSRPLPWPLVYRRMAEPPFCLEAGDIESLTIYQLSIYLRDDDEWQDRVEFDSLQEIQCWRREFDAAIDRAVENLLDGDRCDAIREFQ